MAMDLTSDSRSRGYAGIDGLSLLTEPRKSSKNQSGCELLLVPCLVKKYLFVASQLVSISDMVSALK